MSDIVPKTDGDQPAGTGGDQPAATPQPTSTPAATDDKTVTLSEADYKNLIAQRDRANNTNSDLEDSVTDILKEREINKFLKSNGEKFPDITADDLMQANSPEELETLAAKQQRRVEDAVQKKLLEVQKASAPVLSPEERATELKKLKENPSSQSFGRMLELQESQ
ncbi:hypothetical protein UFOVP667_17 [uncultured Caudovirales phage]|uniref:Scaffolding protein n=1 Tax=uncultured Caudovirales phage TaxID=2100421 RepID=A0A6J5NCM0_9CAUD|nr:hypothetical protein UFOVP667_17 [uncultured Caudovirales phage]